MPSSSDTPFRIILADDDAQIRSLLSRNILRLCPNAVIAEAADGEAAMAEFNQNGADLLIVDHVMPRIDGSALVHALRARRIQIPMIVFSGHKFARQEALSAGATCFLEKSGVLENLSRVLTPFLPKP